jgi:hypothetical protein
MNKFCFAKRIEYKLGEDIHLKPVFDVHYGHKLCDVTAFKKYLETTDENTWFIGGGDLLDSIVVTDKRYRKNIDSFVDEELLDKQIDGMYEMLKPYKEKFLGLMIGNHEDTILKKSNTNIIKRLANLLDIPYLGYSCFYKLILHENNSRVRTVLLRTHHGYGGGSRTQGADLTKFSKDMQFYDADVFLYGHVHRLQFDEVPRLSIVGNNLVSKPKTLVICGTFKKSFSDDSSTTWEETKGFPPTRIGGAIINIKPDSNAWARVSVTI